MCLCGVESIKNAMSYRAFFKAKCFHITLENYAFVYVYAHTDTHTEIRHLVLICSGAVLSDTVIEVM